MSDPNDPYSGGAVPPPPPGGGYTPPPPPPGGGAIQPPPPGGGYQDPPPPGPPGGGYAPPPAPPGPPGGGYQPPPAPPGGYQQYTPGGPSGAPEGPAAFSWGWKKFQENLGSIAIAIGVWVVAAVVLGLIGVVVRSALFSAFSTTESVGGFEIETGPGFFASMVISSVFSLFIWVALLVGNYGITRGALAIASGRQPTTGEMFDMKNFAPYVLTGLLVAVITTIGSFLCFIPGIIAGFLLVFAPYHAADKGTGAVDACKASFETVKNNVGPMVIFYLLTFAAYIVGAILCGIGLLVAVPVVVLASTYMYRSFNGEPVAP